jgi:hypothetical protein
MTHCVRPKIPEPMKSAEVMQWLDYKDPKSFWEAVWREGIPCTRINCRKIVFYRDQVADWLARRSTSGRNA